MTLNMRMLTLNVESNVEAARLSPLKGGSRGSTFKHSDTAEAEMNPSKAAECPQRTHGHCWHAVKSRVRSEQCCCCWQRRESEVAR